MKDPDLYVEEIHVGGNLRRKLALFSPSNSNVALLDQHCVIVYEVKSGSRKAILPENVVISGLKWVDENKLITISSHADITVWDLVEGVSTAQRKISNLSQIKWVYNFGNALYAVASESKNSSNFVIVLLDVDNGTFKVCTKLPIIPTERRKITCTDKYAVYCENRWVCLLPYEDTVINGPMEYYFKLMFNNAAFDTAGAFESIITVEDSVYAVLNIGRIYYWSCVSKVGLNSMSKAFMHVHPAEVCIAATSMHTLFCGTAECSVDKWSLDRTGKGRYQKRDFIERMDAPVESLWLSNNATYILTVLADNSLVILNPALAVVSRPQVMQWPALFNPLDWMGLYVDMENPDYVVTNTRVGSLQWIDPVKWRTVSEFDVLKENVPLRDSVTLPHYNWSNIYAMASSFSTIVTAECRRETLNDTIIRIFKRVKPGTMNDITLLDAVCLPQRIRFIRLSSEEMQHVPTKKTKEHQYFLIVDNNGKVFVYEPDPNRTNKWHLNVQCEFNWNETNVVDCSTIRWNFLATVNTFMYESFESSVVIVWNAKTGDVCDFIDHIAEVRQVRWAPPQEASKQLLLIAAKEQVVAYDFNQSNFLWSIAEPNLQIYTNLYTTVVYKENFVYILKSEDGSVAKKLKFSIAQNQIVITGNGENIRISGLNQNGLTLLKPDTKENTTLREITSITKSTPFSALAKQATSDALWTGPASLATDQFQVDPVRMISVRKLLEGSAHTLAPITKLAPTFIHSCLIPRKQQI